MISRWRFLLKTFPASSFCLFKYTQQLTNQTSAVKFRNYSPKYTTLSKVYKQNLKYKQNSPDIFQSSMLIEVGQIAPFLTLGQQNCNHYESGNRGLRSGPPSPSE